jgi:hypothetical protein
MLPPMLRSFLLPVLLCAALTSSAEPAADPAAELTYAYYTRGCGPIDQPVTMIYLTPEIVKEGRPRAPYVQLWFAGGLDEQGRFAGNWDGVQGKVGGTWCRTDADCNPVARGSMKLQRSTTEGTLNGEIQFELNGPVGGPLRALPLPAESLSCG